MNELSARIAWSVISEPLDENALALIRSYGYQEALAHVEEAARSPLGETPAHRFVPRWQKLDLAGVLHSIEYLGIRVLIPGDDEWPQRLDDLQRINAPVHCLYALGSGNLKQLTKQSVSLVGMRAPSSYGTRMAARLARDLTEKSWTVISGGAFGIDATAHRAVIRSESPTVSVQANGLDRFYPRTNAELLQTITTTGVVISELPPGSAPQRHRFLQRNRIIAALSAGTVVIEAQSRSGAINTAHWASKCLRQVAVIPGPVDSPESMGTNNLVRTGVAEMVVSSDDIIELLGDIGADLAPVSPNRKSRTDQLSAAGKQIWDALPLSGGMTPSQVACAAGLSHIEVRSTLPGLETLGVAENQEGTWRKTRK